MALFITKRKSNTYHAIRTLYYGKRKNKNKIQVEKQSLNLTVRRKLSLWGLTTHQHKKVPLTMTYMQHLLKLQRQGSSIKHFSTTVKNYFFIILKLLQNDNKHPFNKLFKNSVRNQRQLSVSAFINIHL